MAERVQKVLARLGYGSRRQVEGWIAAGEVRVNGRACELGTTVTQQDRLTVRGRPVRRERAPVRPKVLLYHKPAGEVTTRRDPERRPTVFDRLPRLRTGRWVTVGRLDVNTSGLLLLTDDGDLAHRLMHPSYEMPRVYAARVLGPVPAEALLRLSEGIELDDGPARFEHIEPMGAGDSGHNAWYRVTLREGRQREVRRLWEGVGITVSRLIRIGFGPVELPRDLWQGNYRALAGAEVDRLLARVGLREPSGPRRRRPAVGSAAAARRTGRPAGPVTTRTRPQTSGRPKNVRKSS